MYTWVESRKLLKRNQILSLIRHSPKPLSRSEVKRLTGYSMTTVSNCVTALLEEGLLREDACQDTGRLGRKPIFLHLNGEGGYFVGLEFNVERIHCAVLDFAGRTLYTNGADLPEGVSREGLLERIFGKTEECLDLLGPRRDRVLGIGLGLPGYIDAKSGMALSCPYLPEWTDVPIVRIMEERFRYSCCIGNNVSAMGLVFKWLPDYHEDNDFLLISIRSGVRCIPVLNQQPYSGRFSSSGEIGHLKVSAGTRVCDCGHTGCLNTEVTDISIRAILEEGMAQGQYEAVKRLAGGGPPSSALLVQAAVAGDEEAADLVRRTGSHVGRAVAVAANLFAPQKIILSGQLVKAGPLFFTPLRRQVEEECLPAVLRHVEITSSPFSDDIGALGAAALTLERDFNPISHLTN